MSTLNKSFRDLRKELAGVKSALVTATNALESANQALLQMQDIVGVEPADFPPFPPPSQSDSGSGGETTVGNVIQILKDLGQSSVKQIRDEYLKRKLKGYERKSLYTAIFNSIIYLRDKANYPKVKSLGEGRYELLTEPE